MLMFKKNNLIAFEVINDLYKIHMYTQIIFADSFKFSQGIKLMLQIINRIVFKRNQVHSA